MWQIKIKYTDGNQVIRRYPSLETARDALLVAIDVPDVQYVKITMAKQ